MKITLHKRSKEVRIAARRLLGMAAIQTLVLSLSGCGGGGGGASTLGTNVALSNVRLPVIQEQVYEGLNGDSLPGKWTISADLSGDLRSLEGATVYVAIGDPDNFLESSSLNYPIKTVDNELFLFSKQKNPAPGHYTGAFKVSVCLDTACSVQFGGTPISVPYDILVLPGLKADLDDQTQLSSSPNTEVRRTFNVSLPEGVTTWSATILNSPDELALERSPTSPTTFDLVGKASAPGTYANFVELQAMSIKPNGATAWQIRHYQVIYTVR